MQHTSAAVLLLVLTLCTSPSTAANGPDSWYVARLAEFLDTIEWYMVNDILGVGAVHESFVDVEAYVKRTQPSSLGLPDERLSGDSAVPDALFLSYYYDPLLEYDIAVVGEGRTLRNSSGVTVTVDTTQTGRTTSGRHFSHQAVMTATFDHHRDITSFRMFLDSLAISCWLGKISAESCAAVGVTFD